MKKEVPANAVCRNMGCGRKATVVFRDSKGRKQYCCDQHNVAKLTREKSK